MKKFIAVIITLCISALYTVSAFADDDKIKADIAANNQSIKTVEAEIKAFEQEKNEKSKELVAANKELASLKGNIDMLQAEIMKNTILLEEAQAEIDRSFESFSQRLMMMYEQGSNAYIGILLGSENLDDMIKRYDMIREISAHDRSIYDKYKENKTIIESKQQELNSAKTELEGQTQIFEAKISEMNTELQAVVSQINAKRSELVTLKAKATELNTSLSSMDYADALFAEAEKYMGMPYVFGGSTPSTSFDCSGFVCYATTHSGVYNLPRTTAQGIYNQCIKISPSEAKRGDIIFFQGTYNAGETVTHVGFYAGNGKMLHCGNPIQYTSTQTPYWKTHFYAFGRLKK